METFKKNEQLSEFFSASELQQFIKGNYEKQYRGPLLRKLELQRDTLRGVQREIDIVLIGQQHREIPRQAWKQEQKLYETYIKELLPLLDAAIAKLREETTR